MKDCSTLLSICIPTYNRKDKLEEMLNIMIPKISEYNIPIYISDNCSNDDTEQLIFGIKKVYKNIVYTKNTQNIGFDRNFEKVIKLSNTKYQWILGDDDIVEESTIDELINALDKNYKILVLNRRGFNGLSIESDLEYSSKEIILSEKGGHISYISTLVISKEVSEDFDFCNYYGSEFIHLGLIFEYLAKHETNVLFLSSLTVTTVPSYISTYSNRNFDLFIYKFYDIVFSLPSNYSIESKISCVRNNLTYYSLSYYFIINAKLNKEISFINIVKIFKYITKIFSFKMQVFTILIILIPNSFLSLLRLFRRYSKLKVRS